MHEVVYSHNGEDWTEDYGDMRSLALNEIVDPDQITITYKQGIKDPFKHDRLIDGDDITTFMEERAYDECSEFSDGYLDDLSDEDKEELGKLVVSFLNEKAQQPRFYQVIEIEEITSPLNDDELKELNE